MSPEVRQLLEEWAALGLTTGIFNRIRDLRERTRRILEVEDEREAAS